MGGLQPWIVAGTLSPEPGSHPIRGQSSLLLAQPALLLGCPAAGAGLGWHSLGRPRRQLGEPDGQQVPTRGEYQGTWSAGVQRKEQHPSHHLRPGHAFVFQGPCPGRLVPSRRSLAGRLSALASMRVALPRSRGAAGCNVQRTEVFQQALFDGRCEIRQRSWWYGWRLRSADKRGVGRQSHPLSISPKHAIRFANLRRLHNQPLRSINNLRGASRLASLLLFGGVGGRPGPAWVSAG